MIDDSAENGRNVVEYDASNMHTLWGCVWWWMVKYAANWSSRNNANWFILINLNIMCCTKNSGNFGDNFFKGVHFGCGWNEVFFCDNCAGFLW